MGEAGLEPASLSAQDPKSCVSANFTTRPVIFLTLEAIIVNDELVYEQI